MITCSSELLDAHWHNAGLCQAEHFQGLLGILLELACSREQFVCSQPAWRIREFISIDASTSLLVGLSA